MVRKDSTFISFSENQNSNIESKSGQTNDQIVSPYFSSETSPVTSYTCIITDLTNPSNTCRKHVINLSSTYTVENLIQEAANYYSYDPFSFNLIWKSNNEQANISEAQISSLTLFELGLNSLAKNIFEIHEKEGPPKRLKVEDNFNYSSYNNVSQNTSNLFEEEEWKPSVEASSMTNSRRNAVYSPMSTPALEYGPVNINNSTMSTMSPAFTYDDEPTGYVGLINQAMTCYLNSLLQTLYMTPEFRNGIYRWNYNQVLNDQDDPKKSIPFQLQRLFLNLQTSNKKSIQTSDLTKSFGWNSDDAFQQHDVQELYRVMFDALEKKFKKTNQENLINELYQGKIKDYVKCLECNTESARVDVYLDIPLCIRPFGSDKTFESVEAALDAFVQPETLDENNKYFCEKCQRMCKAHKGLKFESFPYIISLQLKRFDFDYKTLSRFKIGSTVSFPQVLNVKKYLNKESTEPMHEENLYDYELFSIMIHSGSASGGHYYAYIKSFENNQWYNFNDERVSKIDKTDIIKAFGTSYSIYSSTTAYMLQYRQINPKRNEKFTKVDEFDEHLKNLLNKEINEQIEAERLKEYMENLCKVKVIVPSMPISNTPSTSASNSPNTSTHSSSSSSSISVQSNNYFKNSTHTPEKNFSKKIEKTIDIHKDLNMEQAKCQIIKDLNLADYLNVTNQKCRILKYDSYNEMIDQSYRNESQLTVFEALGKTKYPYNLNWYIEILPEQEEFLEYNSSDLNIKVFNLNMSSFEANELFTLRLNNQSTVNELQNQIAKKLDCSPEKVRMALEKLHTLYNYIYLNKNLSDTLQNQSFLRVNRVFVEYKDESDLKKPFENSKFYYALDTIMNMLQMSVYLPIEEQCEVFLRKTRRHNEYIENQRKLSEIRHANSANEEATLDCYETLASEQTLSSIVSDFNQQTSPKLDANKKLDENEDSMSKMSYQDVLNSNKQKESLNLIENHFKQDDDFDMNHLKPENRVFLNEMETSLDEGIGGSNGSLSTNNINIKSSPNDLNLFDIKTRPAIDINLDVKETTYDDLDVNIDENEINNLNDDLENDNLMSDTPQENLEDDDEFQNENFDYSSSTTTTSLSNILAKPSLFKELKIKPTNRVTFSNQKDDQIDELNSKITAISDDVGFVSETKPLSEDNFYDEYNTGNNSAHAQNTIFENDLDDLPKYSDLQKDNFKRSISDDDYYRVCKSNQRFIRSNLIVNNDLGTRTLEIKMDKRIELNEFKTHVDEYLKIGLDNFRVFRMCPNDLECELTSPENQFLYLTQNTKFLIKLGPPLKYGEYVIPIYKLNKVKGTFAYLCDFMIFHSLSVFNHKELLVEDLKDECNLDISVEKIRLRKKISKRPGNILLDNDIFGVDIFVNAMSELCIEVLDEPEMKKSKGQTSVYLRQWKPDEYELGELEEVLINGNSFELLIEEISFRSDIKPDNIEVLKCLRDFPFKSPILDLHRNLAWKENSYQQMDKLEDGVCYYYRNKTLRLGDISIEKRREMEKEDNLNFRPTANFSTGRKETGIKIHVENS